jgi:hypothetical protein
LAENLREFRRAVSTLKKQGLISGKTASGQKIDARTALPGWKIKGKRLDTLVRKYDDVVSGKATAIVVPPKDLKQFRKAGFETTQGRVLVPHTKLETARLSHGQVSIKSKSGIERVQIPVEFHNLNQYLIDIQKNASLIDAMKKRNEYFGIRFYGGQRARFYSNIDMLIDDLRHYEDIKNLTKGAKAKQLEVYQNIEIIKMTKPAALRIEDEIHSRKKVMSAAYNRKHAKRVYERRKKKGRAAMDQYRARKTDNERERRQRIKRNPAQYAHLKKVDRLRSKKRYDKLHKTSKKKSKGKRKK